MPYRRGYAKPRRRRISTNYSRRRRRLPDSVATAAIQDIAFSKTQKAAAAKLQKYFREHSKTTKLTQTTNRKRTGRFPTKYKPKGAMGKKSWGKTIRSGKTGSKKYSHSLNSSHKHKFKQHITGLIIPSRDIMGIVQFPFKPYQLSELKFYPHPVQQKILLLGEQLTIAGSDNVLSDKIDYELFPEVNDKKLLSIVYYPIGPCANFSGIHAFTRHQINANSEGFSKEVCLGRQSRCNKDNELDFSTDALIATTKNTYIAEADQILTGVSLKMSCQANRNFAVKISVELVRMSQNADVVTNQGFTNSELNECTNAMGHIDYDTAEIIFQQSKILQPCKSNKYVSQTFHTAWSGYYKLTKDFRDETAETLKVDQGGTYKYGQQSKAKVAGSPLAQTNLSNRLFVIIKAKRLGNTIIGEATQSRTFSDKTVSMTLPINIDDENGLHDTVTNTSTEIALDPYITGNMDTGGFRAKATLILDYKVKDGVRNIPIYLSGSNAGKTKILHASTHDSNYATLEPTLNVTD